MQYISELTYRTATTSLDKPYFEMDQMRKNWTNRVKEQEVKQSLVVQEELRLDRKGPPPMLKDISVRPHLSRKKTTGTLSAHLNGLRFVTTDKIKVDIIYANIKSAFYQPAEEGNHNVTIHFELRNPILLDKSKTKKTNVRITTTQFGDPVFVLQPDLWRCLISFFCMYFPNVSVVCLFDSSICNFSLRLWRAVRICRCRLDGATRTVCRKRTRSDDARRNGHPQSTLLTE